MNKIILAALAAGLGFAARGHAQPAQEYSLLQSMNANVLWNCLGGTPDKAGMEGSNSFLNNMPAGGGSVSGAFSADEQRGAIDTMLVGIALQGRGLIPDALCDQDVAAGIAAIKAAYALQIPGTPAPGSMNGAFYTTVTETLSGSTYTVSGSGVPGPTSGNNGANNMRFFLAYSNHALLMLLQNARYSGMYNNSTYVQAWYPQIQAAMDYLYYSGCSTTTSPYSGNYSAGYTSGYGLMLDVPVPNRTLIDASAFRFGYLLLQPTSYAANIANYGSAAHWWINNEFASAVYFAGMANPRTLFDPNTGAFLEGGFSTAVSGGKGNPGFGYDSSYQAVAARFLGYYAAEWPNDIPNLAATIVAAGTFLERRILSYGGYVDDTLSTRTGPTGGWAENKITDFDYLSARYALLYFDALANTYLNTSQTEGLAAAERFPSLVASPVLPPTIVNSTASLANVIVVAGTPYTSANTPINVTANNAGVIGANTETLDPNFKITATGLPAGLALTPTPGTNATSYPTGSGDAGFLDSSVAWVPLTGTASAAGGPYTVTLTAQNSEGYYTFSNVPPSSTAPTYTATGGLQTTTATMTVNVVNQTNFTANYQANSAPCQAAYVWDGSHADHNFGGASAMNVKNSTAGLNRVTYLTFDTSSVSGSVYKAVLRLYGSYGSDPSATYMNTLCYGVPYTGWTQGTLNDVTPSSSNSSTYPTDITWTRAGLSLSSSGAIVVPGGLIQNTASVSTTTGWYQWDVTAWVKGQWGATPPVKLVGFALTDVGAVAGATFNSPYSSTNQPQLVIYSR